MKWVDGLINWRSSSSRNAKIKFYVMHEFCECKSVHSNCQNLQISCFGFTVVKVNQKNVATKAMSPEKVSVLCLLSMDLTPKCKDIRNNEPLHKHKNKCKASTPFYCKHEFPAECILHTIQSAYAALCLKHPRAFVRSFHHDVI